MSVSVAICFEDHGLLCHQAGFELATALLLSSQCLDIRHLAAPWICLSRCLFLLISQHVCYVSPDPSNIFPFSKIYWSSLVTLIDQVDVMSVSSSIVASPRPRGRDLEDTTLRPLCSVFVLFFVL